MLKQNRRNLRLWAEGAREEVLTPHLDAFQQARDLGWVAERAYLQTVCNEFHARVDWCLADHEEPVLKPYDPNAKLADEALTEEEEVAQRARQTEINARIRRWFLYRLHRRRCQTAGLDPRKDPFAVLLAKLCGLTAPPKARQAYQQFMRESHANKIAPVVLERWAAARENNDPDTIGRKEPKAGFRARVARELFAALPEAEKAAIAQCLNALPDFIAPILRGIYEYTGCHSVIVMGGPMPKYNGELRTLNVGYGRNQTAAHAAFPQWDKDRFAKQVCGFMVEYLQTAFSAYAAIAFGALTNGRGTASDQCAAAALSAGDLAGAKYTMSPDQDSDSEDEDSNDEDEEDSDSDSDSGVQPPKKKAKTADKAAAKASTSAKSVPSTGPPKRKRAPKKDTTVAAVLASASAVAPAVAPPIVPIALRPTTTTVDIPNFGPVSFRDPTAGTAYEDLTFEQQRLRNVLRNKAFGEAMKAKSGLVPASVEPPRPRPVPWKKPQTAPEAPRRSSRFTGGEPRSTDTAGEAMDMEEDGVLEMAGS
ncbi:hypothetical protein FB451DRAFT_1395473 [Mycena latifolia]|nr:hypothetical protein FB451DRAFT_1395473 [Mycena latifolia]